MIIPLNISQVLTTVQELHPNFAVFPTYPVILRMYIPFPCPRGPR